MTHFLKTYEFQARQARLRVKLVSILSRFIYGQKLSEIPRTSVHSVDEWSRKGLVGKNLIRSAEVFPAVVAKYSFPASYPPTFRRDKSFDTIKICEFHNVVVSPHTGLVYFTDKTILQESVGGLIRILGWGKHIHEVLQPYTIYEGTCCLVPLPGGIPYFHWLFEAFPRFIRLLDSVENPIILTSKEGPSYVEDGIRIAFDYLGRSFPILESQFPVLGERGSFIQHDDWSGFVHPHVIAMMKGIAHSVTDGDEVALRHLYISRRRAKLRQMENEEQIENELRKIGFSIVFMEDGDLTMKWKTLASASVVVAPHGAGLSNLIACKAGTQVLEIFPYNLQNDCYARLCNDLELQYNYLACKPNVNESFTVDVADLMSSLERMYVYPRN